jgi:DNA-binding response OmpR family regulator
MAKARILVVDDDRPTVKIIEVVLTKEGYEVATAFQGKEGLAKAQEMIPDLIILDIMMPEMNGYEVARRLRDNSETARIAVLMLSAKGDIDVNTKASYQFAGRVQDRMRGFDMGAVEFLNKPVKAKELAQRVKAVLWAGGLAV